MATGARPALQKSDPTGLKCFRHSPSYNLPEFSDIDELNINIYRNYRNGGRCQFDPKVQPRNVNSLDHRILSFRSYWIKCTGDQKLIILLK